MKSSLSVFEGVYVAVFKILTSSKVVFVVQKQCSG